MTMREDSSILKLQRLAILLAFVLLVVVTFFQQVQTPLAVISDAVVKLNHRYVNLSLKLRD